MKVLLDECLPRKLDRELPGHTVSTVSGLGWAGVKNGELLSRAAGEFDVFVTIDRLLAVEQPIPASLAVVALAAQSNRLEHLRPILPKLRSALRSIRPGQVLRLQA